MIYFNKIVYLEMERHRELNFLFKLNSKVAAAPAVPASWNSSRNIALSGNKLRHKEDNLPECNLMVGCQVQTLMHEIVAKNEEFGECGSLIIHALCRQSNGFKRITYMEKYWIDQLYVWHIIVISNINVAKLCCWNLLACSIIIISCKPASQVYHVFII